MHDREHYQLLEPTTMLQEQGMSKFCFSSCSRDTPVHNTQADALKQRAHDSTSPVLRVLLWSERTMELRKLRFFSRMCDSCCSLNVFLSLKKLWFVNRLTGSVYLPTDLAIHLGQRSGPVRVSG